MLRRRRGWLALALAPAPASAHSPVPGLEGFFLALLHPFSTPAQALVILGLGLLVGSYAGAAMRWPLGAFALATLAGLPAAARFDDIDTALYATAFAACSLAALAPGRVMPLAALLAGLGGLWIGMMSLADPGPYRDRIVATLGALLGANLGLLYLAAVTAVIRERYTRPWVAIGLRIAAAWSGAVAAVMLALRHAPAS